MKDLIRDTVVGQTSRSSQATARWDRAGMVVSTSCAVHCTLLPLVAGVLPFMGLQHFADERIEWLFIAGTALIGVVGHARAFTRHHGHTGPGLLFAAGLGLVIVTRLRESESLLEPIAFVVGGSFTAAAHWLNLRLCRCCAACAEEEQLRTSVPDLRRETGLSDSGSCDHPASDHQYPRHT
jgi:hypothetical protein